MVAVKNKYYYNVLKNKEFIIYNKRKIKKIYKILTIFSIK